MEIPLRCFDKILDDQCDTIIETNLIKKSLLKEVDLHIKNGR